MNSAAKEIRKNYSKKISEKLITLIRSSLRILARYFNSAVGDAQTLETKGKGEEGYDAGDIVFVLITYLNIPNVEVRPSIDEVQNMLNNAGKIIISVTKGVSQWKNIRKKNGKVPGFVPNCESAKEKKLYSAVKTEKPLSDEQQSNFFKAVSDSKEVTKGFGMLANCMSGMKLELSQFQMIWERYSEMWTVDREEYVDGLARKKPRLKDFEEDLHRYRCLVG